MATQIYHSSFGRYTLYREVVYLVTDKDKCANCGGSHWTPIRRYHLFRYAYQTDDRNGNPMEDAQDKLFCSVGCMRSYYGIEETP